MTAKGLRSMCRVQRGTCERLPTLSLCWHHRASRFCRPRGGSLRYEIPQVLLSDLPPTHCTVQIIPIAVMLGSVSFTVGLHDLKGLFQPKCFSDSLILSCGKMTVCLRVLLSHKCWECVQSLRSWGRVGWDVSLTEYGPSVENTISVTSSL